MRNLLIPIAMLLATASGITSAQPAALSVTLDSAAFDLPPAVGEVVRLEVSASGGTPPYTYAWDLDGDGTIDRSSPAATIEATFPRAGTLEVSVSVVDGNGASGADLQLLQVRGPRLQIEPVGDFFGPENLNPGNRSLAQILRLTNVGDSVQPAGHVMFVPALASDPEGSDASALRPAAVLTPALVPVPELAVGESTQVLLGLNISREAECGQEVLVDYLGTAWPGGQNFDPVRVLDKRVADPCTPPPGPGPTVTPPAPQPPIQRRSGLYFDGSRPGNGLVAFFRRNGPLGAGGQPPLDRTEEFAGGWYTALPDRTPVWFTLQGELVEGTGELALRKFNNAAAPDGFAPVGEIVGRVWLGRISTTHIGVAWELDDGTSGIETMQTSELELGGINHTQTWFSPAEPGWGLAIESLYAGRPFEFFGAFVYDTSGAPRWVTGDINSFAGGSVNLIGHRPHCPACPWIVDWNSEASPAGSLQISYEESQVRASLDTTIALPDAYSGEWLRSDLQITPIAAPVPVP